MVSELDSHAEILGSNPATGPIDFFHITCKTKNKENNQSLKTMDLRYKRNLTDSTWTKLMNDSTSKKVNRV